MKKFFKIVVIMLLLAALFLASAVLGAWIGKTLRDHYTKQTNQLVGFCETVKSKQTYMSYQMLNEYKFETAKYNSVHFYNQLSKSEKMIYKSFLYAFENSIKNVCIPNDILEKSKYKPSQIFLMLTLDSPLVEQNYNLDTKNFSVNNTYRFLGVFKINALMQGKIVEVNIYSDDSMSLKKEGLKKAQEIVKQMPDGLTSVQKVRYIYNYITSNTAYYTYGEDETPNYIYDALCRGKSNCDGLSNSLALLMRLAGIENHELIYLPEENGAEGHTWNCAQIDSKYYLFDATTDAGKNQPYPLGFALTDDLIRFEPHFKDLTPRCTDSSLMECDVFPEDYTNIEELIDKMVTAWNKKGKDQIKVKIKGGDNFNFSSTIQKFTNRVNKSTRSYHTVSDICLWVIYKK